MSEKHYNAFISYRHTPRDTEVAKQIQHNLEHFHIPKAIREKYHIDRFERLFRDQEELDLNADLAKTIQEAIEASDFLIVICSPAYKESQWCLLEIDSFLKNHDRDHVLCVLSEGEPPAVFPDQLTHYQDKIIDENGEEKLIDVDAEPLACDYRGDFKESKRIELPRLASAMIGCSYDELILRQEKYRRRRLFTILAGIVALSVIAISYLLWSNAQISKNYTQALINESKVLAKESLDYYADMDRYAALQTALNALKDGEKERPVVDEAIRALANASYAYKMAYNLEESWRIDQTNDIIDYFLSKDRQYIVTLDKTGEIRTYAVNDHELKTSFRMNDTAVPRSLCEAKDTQVIASIDNQIISYDYLTGQEKWTTPLRAGQVNSLSVAKVSHSGEYICAFDYFGLRITDSKGDLYLSLPLSDDEPGYIEDFIWSKDDHYIAVKMFDSRSRSGSRSIILFDFETADYVHYAPSYDNICYFGFDDKNDLYIVGTNDADTSMQSPGINTIVNRNFDLHICRGGQIIEALTVSSSSFIDDVEIVDRSDKGYVFIIGNELHLFDEENNYEKTYAVDAPVSDVLEMYDDFLIFVCSNGYHGTLFYADGSCTMKKMFPADFDDIQFNNGANMMFSCFALRKDGNILFFENLYDENVRFFSGESFYYPPEEHYLTDNYIIIKEQQTLYYYDLDTNTRYGQYPLDQDKYYHLLFADDNNTYLLEASGEDGDLSIVTLDSSDLTMIDRSPLGTHDSDLYQNIMELPIDRSESIYLDYEYIEPCHLMRNGYKIYLHQIEDPNTIIEFDLLSKERREHHYDLPDMYLLNADSFFYVSELVSKSDKRIFTVGYEVENDRPTKRKALILDLENDTYQICEETPGAYFCGYLDDERLIYAGINDLYICDKDGRLSYSIPFTSERVKNIAYNDGLLYCLYPNGELRIYEGEKLKRTVTTSFAQPQLYIFKDFHFDFSGNELCLSYEKQLNVIDLNSDSGVPVIVIDLSYLGYDHKNDDFILFGYDPYNLQILYDLARVKRYTASELISRAQIQLDNYK